VVMTDTPRDCSLIQTAFWNRVEIRILDQTRPIVSPNNKVMREQLESKTK
jgi:hypothetical protein